MSPLDSEARPAIPAEIVKGAIAELRPHPEVQITVGENPAVATATNTYKMTYIVTAAR